MKKLFITGVLALGLVGSLNAQVGGSFSNIRLLDIEPKQLGVLIENSSDFDLRIVDNSGTILYKERDNKAGYAKRFDLRLLKEGTYKMEIENTSQITTIPFKISFRKLIVNKNDRLVMDKPSILNSGMTLKLKMETANLPIDVNIFDEYNHRVHSKTYREVPTINATFDFSKIGSGTYRMVVSYNSKSFSETITLQ